MTTENNTITIKLRKHRKRNRTKYPWIVYDYGEGNIYHKIRETLTLTGDLTANKEVTLIKTRNGWEIAPDKRLVRRQIRQAIRRKKKNGRGK